MLSIWTGPTLCHLVNNKPFQKRQILDASKLKEFADNNFKSDKKWRKVPQKGYRKHC